MITGVNSIMYYGTEILRNSGFQTEAALIGNIANGVISVLATFVGIWLLGRVGRRPMRISRLAITLLSYRSSLSSASAGAPLFPAARFRRMLPIPKSRHSHANGVISVLATFVGIWLLGRVGRRPMLMTGLIGTTTALLLIGIFSSAGAPLFPAARFRRMLPIPKSRHSQYFRLKRLPFGNRNFLEFQSHNT